MKTEKWIRFAAFVPALTILLLGDNAAAQTKKQEHWVATWAAAAQQPQQAIGARGAAPAAGGQRGGAAVPATAAPTPATGQPAAAQPAVQQAVPPAGGQRGGPVITALNNQTVRMIVRTSIGGQRIRVQFSNAFGTAPVMIGAAHVALRSKDSAIVPGSDRAIAFNGKSSAKIVPGGVLLSDPIALSLPKLSDLAISVYLPEDNGPATRHSMALHTTYVASGDATAAAEMSGATASQAWFFISAVDVDAPADSGTIVAYGDSITDGATSTPETNRSWPSLLAERLANNRATANIGIVNLGISGNRVLGDGAGVSALARFDRDVLSQAGVKWVMILEGINDIAGGTRGGQASLTSDDLIGAMKQMIDRAHTHGIKVIGCTLTPAGNVTDAGEAIRTALNEFIRNAHAFDAVVDFDVATRDANSLRQFRQGFNNGDRLHPNDAGYKAMADAVDLSLFAKLR